jgi:hypothetical protein
MKSAKAADLVLLLGLQSAAAVIITAFTFLPEAS